MNKIYTKALKKIFFVCSCAFILMACKNETIPKNKIVSLNLEFDQKKTNVSDWGHLCEPN